MFFMQLQGLLHDGCPPNRKEEPGQVCCFSGDRFRNNRPYRCRLSAFGSGIAKVENAYPRALTVNGNETAQGILSQVFRVTDASWRGIGLIPSSGMKLRKEFSAFDAEKRFQPTVSASKEPPGCACGQILIGLMTPPDCPLYGKTCTPVAPIGPCMVSTE